MKKKLSMTQTAVQVLDELLAMPDKEFKALVKKQSRKPRHWATRALMDAGHFDQFKKRKRK